MKKNIITKVVILSCFIGCLLLSISCSKNDLIKYDTSKKDAVYFNVNKKTDSIFYNFGFDEITKHTIEIPVNLMGLPRDFDREFAISLSNDRYVNKTVVPAVSDYFSVPKTVTLPADSIRVNIPVTLKRHTDLENQRAIITLNLEANDNFAIRGHSEYTITFDDKTPPTPNWWLSDNYGAFTKFKGQLFFRYFRKMKDENETIYNAIVARWGKFLEKEPNDYTDNPLVVYRISFLQYVQQKMYDYSLANPDLKLNISKPSF